jgi:hypothetical protein
MHVWGGGIYSLDPTLGSLLSGACKAALFPVVAEGRAMASGGKLQGSRFLLLVRKKWSGKDLRGE